MDLGNSDTNQADQMVKRKRLFRYVYYLQLVFLQGGMSRGGRAGRMDGCARKVGGRASVVSVCHGARRLLLLLGRHRRRGGPLALLPVATRARRRRRALLGLPRHRAGSLRPCTLPGVDPNSHRAHRQVVASRQPRSPNSPTHSQRGTIRQSCCATTPSRGPRI